MSRAEYQAVALLAASAGVLKLLEQHREFDALRPTLLWTLEALERAVRHWPVTKDGPRLLEWLRPKLESWQAELEHVQLDVAVQLVEQMTADLAGRLRDPRKLVLLDDVLAGIHGLSDAVDSEGRYDSCREADRLLRNFYLNIGFVP